MSEHFALVTGTTGFIAARLVPALLAEGWRVRATGRRPRPDDLPEEVEYQPADLVSDDLGGLCAGITHVFHLAGASSSKSNQEEMERDNIGATARLLDAAGQGPSGPSSGELSPLKRFVHMSSTSIYGEEKQLPLPVREDVEPNASRGYGKAK